MPTDVFNPDVQEVLDAAPLAWAVGMGVAVLIGLILWALGGKLAKTGVVVAGFVLGGLAAMSVALAWTVEGASGGSSGGVFLIALGVGGAIAGALLAMLLFRLWIAMTAALVLAAVVPAAVLIWTGSTPQATEGDGVVTELVEGEAEAGNADGEFGEAALEAGSLEAVVEEMKEAAGEAMKEIASDPEVAENLTGDLKTDLASDEFKAAATEQAQKFLDVLNRAWAAQREALGVWWEGLGARQRQTVMGGSVIGAVVGLLLGLVLPKVAASLQTALVGSVLMFFAGGALLTKFAGAGDWLPATPRAVLLSVGLITLIGLLLQCTAFRKKTDS